jgi:hypothetical protein
MGLRASEPAYVVLHHSELAFRLCTGSGSVIELDHLREKYKKNSVCAWMGCVGGSVRTFAQGHDFETNNLQTTSTSQCQTQCSTTAYTSNAAGTVRLRASHFVWGASKTHALPVTAVHRLPV